VPIYEGHQPCGAVDFQWVPDPELGIMLPESWPTGKFTPCPYLDGAPCFYDGSCLAANAMLKVLIAEGGEAVWKQLEERYNDQFMNGPLEEEIIDA
jgi:hypothetical protein